MILWLKTTTPLIGLLLGLAFYSLSVFAQDKPPTDQQQARLLLTGLGVSEAVAQIDRVIEQTLTGNKQLETLTPQQRSSLKARLKTSSDTQIIAASVQAYVASRLPANTEQVMAVLNDPLFARAKNFDVSLEMEGAFQRFQQFQQRLNSNPVSKQRLTLVQRLDAALYTSTIAALLQTEIERTAGLLAAQTIGGAAISSQAGDRQQQRQRYMATVMVDLHLFSYRYMQDDELESYVQLLEQDSVQAFLAVSLRALRQSLQASRAIALQP